MERQRGSVLVLVAIFGLVLMGFSALALDIGRHVATRTRLQRVVDAAALAGGKDLSISQNQARTAALDFANRNGVAITAGEVSFPAANQVRVAVTRPVSTTFARVFGITAFQVPADATVRVASATSLKNLRPWGIPQQDFQSYTTGITYKLKLSDQAGTYAAGNYQALSLDGTGGNTYRDTIVNGSTGRYAVGDTVPTQPGNQVGPTKQGLNDLLNGDSHTTYQQALAAGDSDCPRLVTMVIIRQDSLDTGRSDVVIAGFATFFITTVKGDGEIDGQFIRYVEMSAGTDGSAGGIGTQAISLID